MDTPEVKNDENVNEHKQEDNEIVSEIKKLDAVMSAQKETIIKQKEKIAELEKKVQKFENEKTLSGLDIDQNFAGLVGTLLNDNYSIDKIKGMVPNAFKINVKK